MLSDKQCEMLIVPHGTKITTRIPGLTAKKNAALIAGVKKKEALGGVRA